MVTDRVLFLGIIIENDGKYRENAPIIVEKTKFAIDIN